MKKVHTTQLRHLLFVLLFSFLINHAFAVDYYSQGVGDFHTLATWNDDPGGAGAAPVAILAADNFFIQNGDVITIAVANPISVNSLTVTNGSLVGSDALTLGADLTVGATGVVDINANILNVAGVIANTGTVNFSVGTVNYTGTGAQTLLATTYGDLGFSGAGVKSYTGTITTGSITNTGATFNAGANTLNISGSYTSSGTDDLSTATVDYNGAGAQTVLGTTYATLTLSNAGTKTAGGNIVTTDVANAVTFDLGTNILDISGVFSGAGTYDFSAGTVQYTGGAQNVLATTYENIEFSNGAKTPLGDITTGNLINTGTAFDLGANTLNISGNYTSTGTDDFTTGTVDYNGAGAQTVLSTTYNDVIFSGGGTKTAAGTLDINGNITINDATTFADGGFFHRVAGNWTENDAGAQRTGAGSIIFDGGGVSSIGGVGEVGFNDLVIEVAGTVFENYVQVRVDSRVFINTGTAINQVGQPIEMYGAIWREDGTGATTGNSEVRFRGTADIRGDSPVDFNRLRILGGGDVILLENIAVAQNLRIDNNSTLDLSTFSATGGNNLQMNGANSLLRVGGANNFPTGFNNATFTNGTVEYYFNGAQDLTGTPTVDYFNLQITGTGDKTVQSNLSANFIDLDAGNLVSNNFDVSSTTSIDIESGASFMGGNGTVAIGTDLLNDGIFMGSTGDISIANDLDNNGVFVQGTGDLTVSNTFDNANGATFDGGTGTITVTNNFTNNGDFDRGAGAITVTAGNFVNANTGVFDGGTADLNITTGSLANNGTMDVSAGGNVDVIVGDFITGNGSTFTGGAGTVYIAGNLTSDGAFTGVSGAIDIDGNMTIGATGSFTESSTTTNLAGNLTSDGTFTANGGTFTFDGNTNSVIDGGTINFNNLVVNKSTEAIEVEINDNAVIVNAATSLQITIGTFDFQEFGGNGHSLGAVSGTADATIALAGPEGGTAVWPTAPGTDISGYMNTADATINFNTANNYTIPSIPPGATNYPNVILSEGGTKTADGAFDINGTFTINDATTFADGGFTHTVAGDWTETDAGAGYSGTGTVLFDGNSTVSATAGTLDFNNVEIATAVTVSAGASDLTLTGNWTENGTGAYSGTGTIIFTGAVSSINGDEDIILPNVTVDIGDELQLNQNVIITTDLNLSDNSIYETNTFTTTGGNDINPATNVTVRVGSTDNFPTGFNPVTFTSGTVEYYLNGAQNVPGTDVVTYFNLQSTGTGDKTAQNTISANFIDIDAGVLVSAGNDISSTGDTDVEAGGGVNMSAGGNYASGDDLLNNGAFTGGTGTITTVDDIRNQGTGVFIQGTGDVLAGGDLRNENVFTGNSGSITVSTGVFLNDAGGTYTGGTGTLTVVIGAATNSGVMTLVAGGDFAVSANSFTNDVAGQFTSGVGTITIADDLINDATGAGFYNANTPNGTTEIAGNLDNNGVFNALDATINIATDWLNSGTFGSDNSLVTIDGNLTNETGGTLEPDASTFSFETTNDILLQDVDQDPSKFAFNILQIDKGNLFADVRLVQGTILTAVQTHYIAGSIDLLRTDNTSITQNHNLGNVTALGAINATTRLRISAANGTTAQFPGGSFVTTVGGNSGYLDTENSLVEYFEGTDYTLPTIVPCYKRITIIQGGISDANGKEMSGDICVDEYMFVGRASWGATSPTTLNTNGFDITITGIATDVDTDLFIDASTINIESGSTVTLVDGDFSAENNSEVIIGDAGNAATGANVILQGADGDGNYDNNNSTFEMYGISDFQINDGDMIGRGSVTTANTAEIDILLGNYDRNGNTDLNGNSRLLLREGDLEEGNFDGNGDSEVLFLSNLRNQTINSDGDGDNDYLFANLTLRKAGFDLIVDEGVRINGTLEMSQWDDLAGTVANTLGGSVLLSRENNVTFDEASDIIGEAGVSYQNATPATAIAAFSADRMIIFDGTVNTGEVIFEGTNAISTDFEAVYPFGSGTHLDPLDYQYNYLHIDNLSATRDGTNLPTLALSVIPYPSGQDDVLNKYWSIDSENIISITQAEMVFKYHEPEEITLAGGTLEVKRTDLGIEYNVPTGTADGVAETFTSGAGNTALETEWRLGSVITLPQTYYSFQDGDWDDPNTWTKDPFGLTQTAADIADLTARASGPDFGDNVYIINGRNVELSSVAIKFITFMSIDDGELFIPVGNPVHEIPTIEGDVNGVMRLENDADLPNGDYTDFVAADGGTIIFENNTATQLSVDNGETNNTFNNLVLTGTGNIRLNNGGYVVNGNLSITGGVTVEQRQSIDVFGDLFIETASVLEPDAGRTINIDLYGDMTVDGTFTGSDKVTPSYTLDPGAAIQMRFRGEDTKVNINGPTIFDEINVIKNDNTNIVEFSATDPSYTLFYSEMDADDDDEKAFEIDRGTLKLNENIIVPTLTEGGRQFLIEDNATLWINGAEVYSTSTPGNTDRVYSVEIQGKLIITSGFLDTRDSRGVWFNQDDDAEIEIDGGTLTANAIFTENNSTANGDSRGSLVIKSGTVNLNGTGIGSSGQYDASATLSIASTGAGYVMSGGTLNINGTSNNEFILINANAIDISATAGIVNITNGVGGIATNGSPFFDLNLAANPALYVDMDRATNVINDLTIGTDATLDANGFDLTLQGDFEGDAGFFIPDGNTTYFNSTTQNQEITGVTSFANVQIDNSVAGGVVSISALGAEPDVTLSGNLEVLEGDLYMGKTLIVNGNVTNNQSIFGPRRLTLSGGIATHEIGGDGNGIFRSVELDDANGAIFTASQTFEGTVLMTNGNINLDVYAMMLSSAADIDNGGGGFSTSKMVFTAGNASDGGIQKTYGVTGSFTFPIGTTGLYTPAVINVSAATTLGTITVSPVIGRHPVTQGVNNALEYYWDVEQSGFTGVTATHIYTYDESDVAGTEASYLSAYYTGTWTEGVVADVDEANNTVTFSGIGLVAGDFTAGETTAFVAPTTYYSRNGGGDWGIASSWTLNATHTGGAAGGTPAIGDKVVIGDNDIITADADNLASASIVIENGSTLDLVAFTGHDFGIYEGIVGEEGELRITVDANPETAEFPSGEWGDFLGSDGGTVVYYEPVDANNSVLELPSNINTYYNLYLDPIINNDSRRIYTNTQKLTIYNDFIVQDNSSNTSDFNLGEVRMYGDLDVRNDFILDGGAEFVVMNNVSHTIEVGGDFRIDSNYGFFDNNGNAIHNLYISGNLVNNGVGDFDDSDARSTRIHFIGSSNSTWTGGVAGISGSEVSSVGQLIIDFDDTTTMLTINDPKFDFTNTDVDFGGIYGTNQMNLFFGKGIVQFQDALSPIDLRSSYELTNDGEIWMNAPGVTMETDGNLLLAGVFRLTDGIMNVGNGGDERLEPIVDSRSRLEIEGGVLNVMGQVRRTTFSTLGALDYRQSGGVANIGVISTNVNTRGTFEVLNSGSYFEMTGGELVIGRNNNGGGNFPAIYLDPTAYNVTGGTLVVGDATAVTLAGNIQISSTIPLYNIRVDNGANNGHVLQLDENPLVILNDLTIGNNTTVDANGQDLFIGGDFSNGGTYDYGTNTTYFNNTSGIGTQDLTASGAGLLDFFNLSIASQTTVQPTGLDMTVFGDLTISLGTLEDNGQVITVRGDVTNDDTHSSNGAGQLLVLDDDLQEINGDGTGIFGNFTLDNASNVRMNAKARVNGDLTFTNGNLLLGNYELTLGTASVINGASSDNMIVTDGLSSDGGVIKEFTAGAVAGFEFPVGDGSIFTPASYTSTTAPTAAGRIRVIRVGDKHPATQDPLETQLDYYWKVSTTFTDGTFTHLYNYDQGSVPATFDETDVSAVVGRFDGIEWFEGTTDVGSFNSGTNIITVAPGGSPASFITGDYTIAYDPEFDIVPRYRSFTTGSWAVPGSWELFTAPGGPWAAAPTAPTDGSVVTIQSTHAITVPAGVSILATSMEIESDAVLDIEETTGHDFTSLFGTGKLRLSSSNFPAGVVSDFVSTTGGIVEYGQGSGNYTMPSLQTEYNDLIIDSDGNTVSLSTSDLTLNGDITINANAIWSNTTNRVDMELFNGNWINNGTFQAGTALLGDDPTVTFSSMATAQSIQGSSTTSFYNLEFDKSPTDLVTDVDVTVEGDLMLTSGSIDIADDLLTVNGQLVGTGTIKGSSTASLAIGGTTGGSAGTINFETGFNELNDFTLNRVGVGGEVTLGSDVTVRDITTLTDGELVLDGGILTMDGTMAVGGVGTITGTCTGGVVLTDSDGDANSLGGTLRFTVGSEELGTFTMNKPGNAGLGSSLTICTLFDLVQGELALSTDVSHTLTVNGVYSRTTGTLAGSANSNLTIDNGASATAELVFTSNAVALLNDFTLNKSIVGPAFSTGDITDEMIISGVMELQGSSVFDISGAKILNLTGYTNGSGSMRGSTSTILNIGGATSDGLGILNFESGNRIVEDLTMNRANGTATLGTDLEVDDVFTMTDGAFELNDNKMTLSGTAARTNGTITGSSGSDLVVTGAPNDLGGELHFTDDGANGQRLRDLTMSKVGTAIIGTDLTIRRNLTTTSGEVVLPSGVGAGFNTLTLLGNHVRESAAGTGTLTGSNESHIEIYGTGDLGDPLYFTTGAQFIQELLIDRQTSGIVELGTDLRVGETADTDGALTMTNGEIVINSQTLTIVASPAGYTRTNGTFTGSATSRMALDGTGNLGDGTATGALYFTDNGADGQQLIDFDVQRSNGSAYLGTDLTVLDSFYLEQSDFNIGINGNRFEINGTPVSTATVGRIFADNACGGTSRLIVSGTNALGQIGFNTSGEFMKAFRITNTNPTFDVATMVSNSELTVCDTFELANDSDFGLGGASGAENTLTLEGYFINDGVNTLVGSHFANLILNGNTADNIGGTAETPIYFDALTADGQYVRTLTIDRGAGTTPGTITLGTNLNIGDETTPADYGTFTFTDGILELNDLSLRLNSAANNFTSASATRSVFRGSTLSDLYLFGPGDLGGTIFFIADGGDADAQVLENFRINRSGGNSGDNEVDMGSNLRVDGDLHLEYGRLDLSNNTSHILNINGTLTRNDVDPTARKVENDGGLIGGTGNGNITIGNGSTSQVNIFLDDGTTGTRTLRNFNIERVNNGGTPSTVLRSELRTNGVLNIGTNATLDLEVNKTGAASTGSRGLLIFGTLVSDGLIQGSFTEDIICQGTIGGALTFEAGARELRSLIFWNGTNTTVALGTDLTIGDPSALNEMYLDLSLSNTRTSTLILDGNTLTLNSSANRFADRNRGTLTGDYSSTLLINGTGDLGGDLYFASGARELEFLLLNRTATGIASLGTDLTVGDASDAIPSGNITLTEGAFDINGNSLTLNSDHIRTNGVFRGDNASDLTISGRGDFAPLVFDVTSELNRTLENLTITRLLDDAGTSLDIDMGSDLIVGANDDTDIINIADNAVLSIEDNELVFRGTGNMNTSGALRGSYTSLLTIEGLGTAFGTFRFRTDNATDNYLQHFTMNRTDAGGNATLGTNLNVGEPSGSGNQFNGEFDLTNGSLVMNSLEVIINSSANEFTRGANGSFTGDYSADLILNGPNDLGSSIAFSAGAERLENLFVNRTSNGVASLGSNLTMGDAGLAVPTGVITLNEGSFSIGSNTLTINNEHNRINGDFIGSTVSQMIIADRGDFDPLIFDTSSDANHTLRNLTITRTLDAGGASLDIDMGTNLIVGVGGVAGSELSLDASTVLSLEGFRLTLNGDLTEDDGTIRGTNTSSMTVGGEDAVTGTLKFTTGAETLDAFIMNRSGATANITLGTELTLDGTITANSLTLTDGLVTTTTTNLMTLNGSALVTGATYTDGGTSGGSDASYINGPIAKRFTADLGTFRFPIGKNSTFLEAGVKAMNAFPTTFRAEYFDNVFSNVADADIRPYPITDPRYVQRVSKLEYWDIDRTEGSSTARILLHWDASSDVNQPLYIKVGHYHDSGDGSDLWEAEGLSGTAVGDATSGYHISDQAANVFSPFTHATNIKNSQVNPLPITLVSFNAEYVEGRGVKLTWKTSSEVNNKGFILKRAIGNQSDMEWLVDYIADARLVGQGNSKDVHEYEYWDTEANLKPGDIHYYQLYQEDFDGKVESFRIRAVNVDGQVTLFQNYPNPAKGNTTLSFSLDKERKVRLVIYNTLGQQVSIVTEGSLSGGTHEYDYSTFNLPTGTYFIELQYDGGKQTKKMLIAK